jgi:hypothetical protein
VQENRTMDNSQLAFNPFALMMNPEAVIQAMERSDRLGRLARRICKPLDKPLVAHAADEAATFDAKIEHADDAVDD